MDIVLELRNSNSQLLKLERELDIERDTLINDPSISIINNSQRTTNSTYFSYLWHVDKYSGFANEYTKELATFKKLLHETVNIQKPNSLATNYNNKEITSNYLPTNILSCPVIDNSSNNMDERYKYVNVDSVTSTSNTLNDDDDVDDVDKQPQQQNDESRVSNEIEQCVDIPVDPQPTSLQTVAVNNIINKVPISENKSVEIRENVSVNNMNNDDDDDDAKSMAESIKSTTKSVATSRYSVDSSNKRRNTMKAKVVDNTLSYKYNGNGFDIWKKNHEKPIYSITQLQCWRTFGNDKDGLLKLKKFLIKRGGFNKICIENIEIRYDRRRARGEFGLINIRDSIDNIDECMNKINESYKEDVINKYGRNEIKYWKKPNNK